jgi:hypothetical protein
MVLETGARVGVGVSQAQGRNEGVVFITIFIQIQKPSNFVISMELCLKSVLVLSSSSKMPCFGNG